MSPRETSTVPWSTRPVFISSTFRDMQAERDYLRHAVFPLLEEELRKRRIRLELIDLRQGVETADVPDEAAREQLVLKVCLEEIQRSRPFLIVLLGDRYGSVLSNERMEAAVEEAGFDTDLRDKSVTALEIEFGILKQSPDQRRRSFFYFREPLPYAQMPESLRANYSDKFSDDPETLRRYGLLGELKKALAADPELAPRVHPYHAAWDASMGRVSDLKAWGEKVSQHLLQELDAELRAAETKPPETWEQQERAELAEFIDHRRRDFVGRQELLNELTNIALSPVPEGAVWAIPAGVSWGACVTGDPGSGKSAIFAELFARLSGEDSILLLSNAAGATAHGSQVESMLERFIEELADVVGEKNPIPEKATPDDVDAAFASLLGRASVKRRVVVLLDALNQFNQTTRAEHVTWLRARQWPANARLIATSLNCTASEALSQWAGIEELEVPPLSITDDEQSDDVANIARAVYQRYHRQVNWPVVRTLRQKQLPDESLAAGNPLWLTLALEQINLLDADDFARADKDFADRGGPAEQQRAMLIDTAERMPPTVAGLYGWLLAQSEKIFGMAATRSFAALIAVSRSGWRESDLLKMIPTAADSLCLNEPIPELNDLELAAVRRSFRAHLVRRGTLEQLDFFHVQMREAVHQRMLGDAKQTRVIHRRIADHLESLPREDPVRIRELMVHLIAGDVPERAARTYAELYDPSSALTVTTQVLAQHIQGGNSQTRADNTVWVTALLTESSLTNYQIGSLAKRFTFYLSGAVTSIIIRHSLLDAARSAMQRLVESAPAISEWQHTLSASLSKLGDLTATQGNLSEAQRHFGDSLRIMRSLAESDPANGEWQHDYSLSLSRLGNVAQAMGHLAEAQQHFSEALRVCERLVESDPANPTWQRALWISFGKLGDLASALRNVPLAQLLWNAAHRITLRLAESEPTNILWRQDLSMSYTKLGDLAVANGDLRDAQQHFGESHRIAQRLADSNPADAERQYELGIANERLGNLAIVQKQFDDARSYYSVRQSIIKHLTESDPNNSRWQRDLSVSFGKLGNLAVAEEDLHEALQHFVESLRVVQRLAKSDSANVTWQRDLWVANSRVAMVLEKNHSPDAIIFWRHAYDTLTGMLSMGMLVSAQDKQFLQQLRAKINK
ncbi:MAG: DUF4062 domain-containing protein [Planctomycetaceae bacterium]